MRSFIAQLILSFAIATSAKEQCEPVSDVVQVLHAVPYAPELCSIVLQISTATTTSISTETIIETRSIETTETITETETFTETETTVTSTTTSTADAVLVTETETIKIQACRPTITIKKRNTALETASASETCTKNKSASTTTTYPIQPTSAVKTSTTSTSTTTCSSSTSGSYKAMSSYPAVSSTFEYRYAVTSSVVQPYHAVTSSIIPQYPAVNSSIIQQYTAVDPSTYQPYPTVDSTSTITSSEETSTPTPLVLCAEVPAELQRFECARITQGCGCLSLESPTTTQTVYSSVTVVEQSITTFMAYITTIATVTSMQLIDATEQYTPTTTIVATVTEAAPGPDFNNDPNNCGACGNVCPNDGICSLGKCANRNPTPTQAVVNPGFEDASQAPWILFPGGYQMVNTGDPQYGLKTPRVARGQGLFASIRQVPTILPGAYLVQFSIKVEGPDPSKCQIYLTGIAEYAYGPAANSDWNTYTYSLTSAGSNNQFIRIVVSCASTPQSGYVYFDNITVKPIS